MARRRAMAEHKCLHCRRRIELRSTFWPNPLWPGGGETQERWWLVEPGPWDLSSDPLTFTVCWLGPGVAFNPHEPAHSAQNGR